LKLSRQIFDINRLVAGKIPVGDKQCRFDFNVLEKKVKELIAHRLGHENHPMLVNRSALLGCRTFVVAKMAGNITATPAIFRSYSVEGEPRTRCALWQAARATTAAPTFFAPMPIDDPPPRIIYIDGGLGYNNPSRLALAESRRIWGVDAKVCLVSIGTGQQPATSIVNESQLETDLETQKSMFKTLQSALSTAASKVPYWDTATKIPAGVLALLKMANALTAIATDTENVHDTLQREAEQIFAYFRFNVDRDVGNIGLEEWKKEHALATNTLAYSRTHDISKKKSECSNCLIDPTVFYGK
jgi:patatin-like phospholipase/acyl hydrolase